MIGKIGLAILASIQIYTSISMFFSSRKDEILGIKTLSEDMSIFRYLLSSLWISISVLYILGVFSSTYFIGASVVGIVNITLEIICYWVGFSKNRKIPKWYPPVGTIVMAIPLVLIVLNLLISK